MGYPSLQACLADLERTGQLARIDAELDADQELAAVHRRVYAAGGPALLFTRVKGCAFPMASNLFGTLERTRFLFRDRLRAVRHLVELKTDPNAPLRRPWRYLDVPRALWTTLPFTTRSAPVRACRTTLSKLPRLRSWPHDGGGFVTLPLVLTEDPARPGWRHSNLGMYRVQLDGNRYAADRECGLHYQIHRGIGIHHTSALNRGESLRVCVAIGGPPSLTVAAVMPLPEDLPELAFAGALGGRRVRLARDSALLLAEADFCIVGTIDPERQLPEGPFGDHLGYYSLTHDFPVLRVEAVYHRRDAVWPFTVVGRPPQEDTSFGAFIHELTGPVIPTVLPGVHAVHAVDAAGVHPLLLAIGSERYVPYAQPRKPRELLTCASAILGQGQLSLAKYLFIVAKDDDPALDVRDVPAFLRHVLARADWRTDLHFHTRTTIDTLDYSGSGLNEGSKLVVAVAGPPRRDLPTAVPADLRLPDGFGDARACLPGVLAVTAPPHPGRLPLAERLAGREPPREADGDGVLRRFCTAFAPADPINAFPLVVLTDDAAFAAASPANFLWVTFTRSDPAPDTDGIGAWTRQKHFGCDGSLVIDARVKPHHAPPLEEDPAVAKRVEALAARGGPLHGLF
jgi:4-hydroxy-3-polyprenylbenzoate decarboxylase